MKTNSEKEKTSSYLQIRESLGCDTYKMYVHCSKMYYITPVSFSQMERSNYGKRSI